MFGHGLVTSRIVFLLGWIILMLNHVLPAGITRCHCYHSSFECGKDSFNVENNLKSSLLCNGYRVDTRPRHDYNQTVNVTLSFHVLTYELKESDLLNLGVWMDMQWTDDLLRWNSTQWSGIERLAINSDEIWLPDFRHFSSFYNPEELPDCANPKCSVAMNGTVICLPVCTINAKCDADYSRWPFDTVRCNMWYGMWAHSMDEVDIHLIDVCLGKNHEFKSPEWAVVALENGRSTVQTADEMIYPVLNVGMVLIRRASFEHVAVVGPILVLALLNLYIVWLRSTSFERKVLLALSTFSHFSYVKQLEWALPSSRDTLPDCLIFLVCSTVLSVVLLFFTLLNCWIRMRHSDVPATGSFIDRITGSFSQSRVAELLLAADYLELNYIVDVQQEEKSNFWERFGKLFDRALAIVCVIVYVVLVWLFIPFSHRLDELSGVKCLVAA
ncbi:neuronal acetylcholine receptor subunit beta-3-like [Anopheles marshallii]|uniref:neuronal acetylcholine receptor subunit beta-3-like n=1 Tax=Anopheles marshallii TaxID=1521116 RepID=UPI00237B2C73|nr:neuronal acetylcholine receptor subunit beta-3-like [Anopheles marshallii]